MFAKIENNKVVQWPIPSLVPLFPNTSFPSPLTPNALPDGYVMVGATTPPQLGLNQKVVPGQPIQQDGLWVQSWNVVDMTEQEIAERNVAQRADNATRAKTELLDTDWSDLASVRNPNLTPHLTNGSDFDAYRLALRAIAINPPTIVADWPVRPSAAWSLTAE